MVRVMTAEEYAEFSGCDLAKLKKSIAEADAGAITADSMDPATLSKYNWTSETEERFRGFLRNAGVDC